MKTTQYELKNGLQVILIDSQAFPSITTLILVSAGSRYENKVNNGVAHFFEHMAFKGSAKYPTALTISSLLDSLGSQQNAFTSKDHTGYWIKAPAKHLNTVLDVLSDMVLYSKLEAAEIEREKGVIVEEINMYEDLPQYKIWDLFEDVIFPKNPLGYLTTGTKATVTKFTRETFVDYMNSLYRPNNAVLVVAGGLDEDQTKMKQAIEEKFGGWDKADTLKFPQINLNQTQPKHLFHEKKTEQAHFVMGYPGVNRYSPDRYALNLLSAILGGGMSSRLFYELRERRGLCYYIQSGLELYEETGYLYTRAGVNVSREKIELAIKLINEEQQKAVNGQLTEEELTKAKEMIKGRTILALEDTFNLAQFFGKRTLFKQEEKSVEEMLAKIDAVKLSHVVKIAKEVIRPEKLNLAVISPHKTLTIL